MKKCLLLFFIVPAIGFAQVKKNTAVSKKNLVAKKVVAAPKPEEQKPADGFLIKGTVTGYPDGTAVNLYNGNNGTPEGSASLVKGKFSFTGKALTPDFKVIAFNNVAPYITLFIDNSLVTITAKKDSIGNAVVKGSPSHNDFMEFTKIIKPYEQLFTGEGAGDSVTRSTASTLLGDFIDKHPQSYITPLAVFRNYQVTMDAGLMEKQYNQLPVATQKTAVGDYIAKQIADSKKNPIGKPLAEFSQADTSGNQVALSSLKGKYVLIDFWASWCRPCRAENPNVVNVFNQYKDRNFTVLGVSLDQAKPAWIDAIKMDGLTWTHVSDLQGWGNAVAKQFEIFSIPQNFLLDPQGNVIAKNLRGPALGSKLASLIK